MTDSLYLIGEKAEIAMTDKQLIEKALEARKYAYAPYSGYAVGACLLCSDGSVYTGCNIENAAFGPGNCAERTAIFKAVSEGKRDFLAIAVVGGKWNEPLIMSYPCGVCRQVMREFMNPEDFRIIVATDEMSRTVLLRDLLPDSFGPENLK